MKLSSYLDELLSLIGDSNKQLKLGFLLKNKDLEV